MNKKLSTKHNLQAVRITCERSTHVMTKLPVFQFFCSRAYSRIRERVNDLYSTFCMVGANRCSGLQGRLIEACANPENRFHRKRKDGTDTTIFSLLESLGKLNHRPLADVCRSFGPVNGAVHVR